MESKEEMREKLTNALSDMIAQNTGRPIKLSEIVTIDYFKYSDGDELFKLCIHDKGDDKLYWNEDNISDAVSRLLDLPEYLKSRRKKIKALNEYGNLHIKGHTQEQWELARRVKWSIVDSNKSLSDTTVCLQIPLSVALGALVFAYYFEQYKKTHREIFSRNIWDHELGKTEEENDNNIFGGVYSSDYDKEFLCEHPDALIHDRSEVYTLFDDDMYRDEIRNVPGSLVDFPGADSNRTYAVVYIPKLDYSKRSGTYYGLDDKSPYKILELPVGQVQKREDGNYDLILDSRKDYPIGTGYRRDNWIGTSYNIGYEIEEYKNNCNPKAKLPPYPLVYVRDINNDVCEFEEQGKSIVCARVLYPKSSNGVGIIYKDYDCLVYGNDLDIRLRDKCTVHYNITDTDGHVVRKHDEGVPAEEIKAAIEQYREECKRKNGGKRVSSNILALADVNWVDADCIKKDMENDKLIKSDQWTLDD